MVWFRVAKEFQNRPKKLLPRQLAAVAWWKTYFQERRQMKKAAIEKARIIRDVRRLLARYFEEGLTSHVDRMARLRKENKKLHKQYINLEQ